MHEQHTAVEHAARPPGEAAAARDRFAAELRRAWTSDAAEQDVSAAYAAYLAVLQEPWTSGTLAPRAAGAHEAFTVRMRAALAPGGAEAVASAFEHYVEDLTRLWAAIDPRTVTPDVLAALAADLTWVSGAALAVTAAAPDHTGRRSTP